MSNAKSMTHENIDMYFGSFIYDPDTLEISEEGMLILDAIRLDD